MTNRRIYLDSLDIDGNRIRLERHRDSVREISLSCITVDGLFVHRSPHLSVGQAKRLTGALNQFIAEAS